MEERGKMSVELTRQEEEENFLEVGGQEKEIETTRNQKKRQGKADIRQMGDDGGIEIQ